MAHFSRGHYPRLCTSVFQQSLPAVFFVLSLASVCVGEANFAPPTPLVELMQSDQVLTLPPRGKPTAPVTLVELGQEFGTNCDLSLIPISQGKEGNSDICLRPVQKGSGLSRWMICSEMGQEHTEIGSFILQGRTLKFEWKENTTSPRHGRMLKLCRLRISSGPKSRDYCFLRLHSALPQNLSFDQGGMPQQGVPLPLDPELVVPGKLLLSLKIPGLQTDPVHSVVSPNSARTNVRAFERTLGLSPYDHSIEIQAALIRDSQGKYAIGLTPFVHLPSIRTGHAEMHRSPFSKLTLIAWRKSLGKDANQHKRRMAVLVAKIASLEADAKGIDREAQRVRANAHTMPRIGVRVSAMGVGVVVPSDIIDQDKEYKESLISLKTDFMNDIDRLNSDKLKIEKALIRIAEALDWSKEMERRFDDLAKYSAKFTLSFRSGTEDIPLVQATE